MPVCQQEYESQALESSTPIYDQLRPAITIGKTLLDISQVTIDFAAIERVPRYYEHRRENNAEHSFMLGLATIEIGAQYFPTLDTGLMTRFALVHDLIELETGDVATFDADSATLAQKEAAEHAALHALVERLPQHMGALLVTYEQQQLPEARLVRHIDKLLPFCVDINGAGVTVMREDYGVTSVDQLQDTCATLGTRFARMFPEPEHDILLEAHRVLGNKFALQFAEA